MIFCFDLDGPLLDVSERYYRLYSDLVGEFGGRPLSKARYWAAKQERGPEEKILLESGIRQGHEEYYSLRQARIESADYLRYDRVWPGVEEMLREVGQGGPVLLVTLRRSSEALMAELEALGLLRLFHHVLSAPAGGSSAERAEIKAGLVRRALGAETFDGWFMGDTEADVLSGRRLGLRTAAVTFGIRTAARLAAAAPDIMLRTPEELVGWGRRNSSR